MLTPQQIQSIKSASTSSQSNPMTPEQAKASFAPQTQTPNEPSMGSRMSSDIQGAASGVNDAISGTGQYQGASTLNRATGAVSSAFGAIPKVASEVLPQPVRAGLDVVGQAGSGVINWLGEKLGSTQMAQDFVTKHPDAAKTLEDYAGIGANTGNIAGNILAAGGGAKIVDTEIKAVPAVANDVKNVAQDVIGGTKNTVSKATTGIKESINPSLGSDESVGQIIQGDKTDIPAAKSALSGLDTTGVKTYSDLKSKLDSEIKIMSKVQDSTLGENKNLYKVQQLATKVGGKEAAHNYVIDGLNQLKDYYTKTNDVANLQKVDGYISKIDPTKGEGLTLQEVNNIARMHGADLNGFNANGELASGLSKVAAENTRMGIKNTIRNLLPDSTSKSIDEKITNLIKTKNLVSDMADKVNKASQKTPKVGIVPKVIEGTSKIVDMGTGGAVGAVRKVLGGAKATTLSPIDIEKNLSKNLKSLKGN